MRSARVFRLAVVMVVTALLMGAVGPIIDHHFVERWPIHDHSYADGIPKGHIHQYQTNHSHPVAQGPSHDGVVVMMPGDGASLGAAGTLHLVLYSYWAFIVLVLAAFEIGLKGPIKLRPHYISPLTEPPRPLLNPTPV